MIVFDLKCDKGHVFEGWFKDSAAFSRERKKGRIACALCGSTEVKKAPVAPRLGVGADEPRPRPAAPAGEVAVANHPEAAKQAEMLRQLTELRRHVETTADYVGPKFAEEARKIHYGETEKRSIYGETSTSEAEALHDEGVEFARIPWLPRHDS